MLLFLEYCNLKFMMLVSFQAMEQNTSTVNTQSFKHAGMSALCCVHLIGNQHICIYTPVRWFSLFKPRLFLTINCHISVNPCKVEWWCFFRC